MDVFVLVFNDYQTDNINFRTDFDFIKDNNNPFLCIFTIELLMINSLARICGRFSSVWGGFQSLENIVNECNI